MDKNKKAIVAFSGGLDTTFCCLWLKKQGYSVITLTVDTGGFTKQNLKKIAGQSKLVGAIKHYSVSATQELYDKIGTYIIKGNILRGGIYPLCAGPERLIIAEKLVEIAVNEKALTVVHGSTGAGNDQIRFDVFLKVLDPNLDILAPIRDLGINREEEIKVLQQYKIPIPSVSKSYSVNKGLLGITIGGKETKSSWESPPDNMYPGITPIENTPNTPKEIILSFQNGIPVALNRKKMEGVAVIKLLTRIGGKYGVGKNIHLGNTILGIKGRVAFAASAMTILIRANQELEKLVLSKWQLFWKGQLGEVYGNFLHEAFYYDPVMKNIEAFIDNSQKYVTGDVKVKLNKGNIIVVGVKSPFSLMDTKVAVYGEENLLWTGQDAKGFAKVYGLSSMISSKVQRGIIQ